MASSNDLGRYLKKTFLSEGSVDWGSLSGSILGGVVVAIFQGLIRLPLSVGEAVSTLVGSFTGAVDSGVGDLTGSLTSALATTWDAWNAGLFTYPLSAAVILGTLLIAVIGWSRL